MKKIDIIISLVIVTLLSTQNVTMVNAQVNELTPAEQACEKLNPIFYQEGKITEAWSFPSALTDKTYLEHFDKTQIAYHSYMGCLFDFAEAKIYDTEMANAAGGVQANTTNTNVIDWMVPNQACLAPAELEKIIKQTSPEGMLAPVLQAQADYKNYLNAFAKDFLNRGSILDNNGREKNINEKSNFIATIERSTQTEIDTSMVTIDLMFTSLKELRLAFVMHVHFQCTLKYLDKYRDTLGELRKLIVPLPGQLRDASVTK